MEQYEFDTPIYMKKGDHVWSIVGHRETGARE